MLDAVSFEDAECSSRGIFAVEEEDSVQDARHEQQTRGDWNVRRYPVTVR